MFAICYVAYAFLVLFNLVCLPNGTRAVQSAVEQGGKLNENSTVTEMSITSLPSSTANATRVVEGTIPETSTTPLPPTTTVAPSDGISKLIFYYNLAARVIFLFALSYCKLRVDDQVQVSIRSEIKLLK